MPENVMGQRWSRADQDRVLAIVRETAGRIQARVDAGELSTAISRAKDPDERRLLQHARTFAGFARVIEGDGGR